MQKCNLVVLWSQNYLKLCVTPTRKWFNVYNVCNKIYQPNLFRSSHFITSSNSVNIGKISSYNGCVEPQELSFTTSMVEKDLV